MAGWLIFRARRHVASDGQQPRTVYIVDDDAAFRESLAAMLEGERFDVEAYPDARAFLQAYDPTRAACLLADVRMPEIDGLQLQAMLQDRGAERLAIVVMTGEGDIRTAVRAMKAGASDFIEKPFEHEVLIARLHELLAEAGRAEEHAREIERVRDRLGLLSPREREVLELLVDGQQNKEIAFNLGISPRTVEVHRGRIMEKMQARTISHLIRVTVASGLIGG